jgi:voltage-gated potassium channel
LTACDIVEHGAGQAPAPDQDVTPYQLFMLSLCAWALLVLGAGSFVAWSESTRTILWYADNAVCLLFFIDFVYVLGRAPNKLQYLRTWGWIDLLSSIPAVEALRWGRAARLTRILRVVRGVKSARVLAHFVIVRRAESGFLASILLSMLLLVFGSIAVLEFEVPAEGNIISAEDAMWWALSTMTTVGYGDRFPITSEGRLVAVFLMASGVGLFGTMSGLVASWFLSPAAAREDSELMEIKKLLEELKDRADRPLVAGPRARADDRL